MLNAQTNIDHLNIGQTYYPIQIRYDDIGVGEKNLRKKKEKPIEN